MSGTSYEERYRGMWESGVSSCPAAAGHRQLTDGSFCARHHSFRSSSGRSGWSDHGVYINETFDSAMECLSYYRWFRVPHRLRALCSGSGLANCTDIEELLNSSGYSVSLTVEELFHMMDHCLDTGHCSREDLHRMRLAYNGITGFREPLRAEIVCWGPVEEVLADSSMHDRMTEDGIARGSLLILVESGLFDPGNRSHIMAADRFLRMTSAV